MKFLYFSQFVYGWLDLRFLQQNCLIYTHRHRNSVRWRSHVILGTKLPYSSLIPTSAQAGTRSWYLQQTRIAHDPDRGSRPGRWFDPSPAASCRSSDGTVLQSQIWSGPNPYGYTRCMTHTAASVPNLRHPNSVHFRKYASSAPQRYSPYLPPR